MVFRVAAAVLFTVVGGIIGFSLSDRLREAGKSCQAVEHLLRKCAYLVGKRHEDVYGICRQLKSDEQLRRFTFIVNLPVEYKVGEDFHIIWRNVLKDERNAGKGELDLLYRLGEILGRSDSENQRENIEALICEAEELSAMHRDEMLKKGRLYRGAGLLFGVMAGIIVL